MANTYTVKETAEILGYCTNSIYAFLKDGRLKGIRMGKGRFRIPQDEIDRLLSVGKPEKSNFTSSPLVTQKVSDLEPGLLKIPNLFDWFIGLASVFLGGLLFLFNKAYEYAAFAPFSKWMASLRISLIVTGIGLLIADFLGKKFRHWCQIFRFILLLTYSFLTFVLLMLADFEGMTIYGSIALVLLLNFIKRIGGRKSFVVYVLLLVMLTPVSLLLSKTEILPGQLQFLATSPISFAVGYLFIVLIGILILKWAAQRNRILFWGLFGLSLSFLVMISFWDASHIYWERAFSLLLVVLVGFLVPWWKKFRFSSHKDRLLVLTTFGSIIFFFFVLIGVIFVVQKNLLEYTQERLVDKVTFGQLLVTQTFGSAKKNIENTAHDSLLVSELTKGEGEDQTLLLTSLLKSLMEGNNNLRKIIVLGKSGQVVAHYPYDLAVEGQNLSYRDYFKQALASREVYTSDLFEAVNNTPVIVVTTVILDKTQNPIGVLVGSLDLNSLSNQLQQIANTKRGEYFILIDEKSNYVIHPKLDLVGKSVSKEDLVTPTFLQKKGVEDVYNFQGIQTLQAHDRVKTKNMLIMIQVPVSEVLSLTRVSLYSIYVAFAVLVIIVLLLLLINYPRIVDRIDGL